MSEIFPIEKMRRLVFNRAAHSYQVDSVWRPSVTQILDKAGLVDKEWYTEESRMRGTAVHEACCLEDEGRLDWLALHEDVAPRVSAWVKFKNDVGFKIMASETCVFSERHGFAGSFDRLGLIAGKKQVVLIDIKSGAPAAWAAYQTAAYALAIHELTGIMPARYAIHLRKEGDYRLYPYNDFRDFNHFIAALQTARGLGFN